MKLCPNTKSMEKEKNRQITTTINLKKQTLVQATITAQTRLQLLPVTATSMLTGKFKKKYYVLQTLSYSDTNVGVRWYFW